jgi:hypothetical protein
MDRCILTAIRPRLHLLRPLAALACALLVAGMSSARAGVSLETSISLNAGDGTIVQDFGTSEATGTLDYAFNPAAAPEVTSHFAGGASALADYGRLNVLAFASLDNYLPATYQQDETSPIPFPAYASAAFTDTLTIEADTAATTGVMSFAFDISGFTSSGDFSGPGLILALKVNGERITLSPFVFSGSGTSVSADVAFTFGVPFELRLETFANVFVTDFRAPEPTYSTFGIANFYNTVTLDHIQVGASSGRPISDVTVNAESGTLYRIRAVPEPSSFVSLALGLAIPLVVRVGRRRQ